VWCVSGRCQNFAVAKRCAPSLPRAAVSSRLKKSFRTLANDTITNVWEGEWQDADSGAAMRGFGVEVWVMRDGKIAVWEAAFNTGRADQTNSVADLLR
jgi:hypothetical protein